MFPMDIPNKLTYSPTFNQQIIEMTTHWFYWSIKTRTHNFFSLLHAYLILSHILQTYYSVYSFAVDFKFKNSKRYQEFKESNISLVYSSSSAIGWTTTDKIYISYIRWYAHIPYCLVVRIPGSHPGGPGSIPGMGIFLIILKDA